jgi:hypothetical protein
MGVEMADRTYEVRINGLVPTEELAEQLGDVRAVEHELRTVLTGHFVDQAELNGFLNLLRSYGLEIVEVRRVPDTGAEDDAEATDR